MTAVHPQNGEQTELGKLPPPAAFGTPPGLEYLTQVDQILIHQQVEILEVLSGWECANKYQIKNALGQQVFFAAEESGICMRQCCGGNRSFVMHITDNLGQEVIRVTREFKCCAGCCWCASLDCCAYNLVVEAPVGQVVGTVRQQCSRWKPVYDIMDADANTVLTITGPCCMCQNLCCKGDIEFTLTGSNETAVGKISKQWGGVVREMFTQADSFGVNFPIDLDVRLKAVVIGATFLIDFMFFEQNKN